MYAFGLLMLLCVLAMSAAGAADSVSLTGDDLLRRSACSNLRLSPRGTITLTEGKTCGTCQTSLDISDEKPGGIGLELIGLDTPEGDLHSSMWPALSTDIVTQIRFRLADGTCTEWKPRNILSGGDMVDADSDGIPDWVSVMQLRENGNRIYSDTGISGWMPPAGDYWDAKTCDRGRFVDEVDVPGTADQSLMLTRATSDGQDTAAMRLDLVPPDSDLTVCGWTKYDLGDETSMGVMSRFHECDAKGRRINKYVLLGDDDFHQPSGRSEWRWRALSFHSLPDTTFLNLYPIRMIAARGCAWAANYEVRDGVVYSDWGRGRVVFQESFNSLSRWSISGKGQWSASDKATDGHSLCLAPDPLQAVTAVAKGYIDVTPGRLYAFRIAMGNDVPPHYDKTHQAWVSAYLEFFDQEKHFVDCCKAMAFRPTMSRPVGAAMHAPKNARYARFMLAASHISYGDRSGMEGPMQAYFDALQLEESMFDPTYTPRLRTPIGTDVPRTARTLEIRSLLLTRDARLSPSLSGYRLVYTPR